MRDLPLTMRQLVHRYLTYLSRVFKSRLSIKLKRLASVGTRVFRLATMFFAPVNRLPILGGFTACAYTKNYLVSLRLIA